MEGELKCLVKVWAWVAASMTYALFASGRIQPGRRRLLALLLALCLLSRIPWFFFSPSLPLLTFIATASLPFKLHHPNKSSPPPSNSRLLCSAVEALLFAALTLLDLYKHRIDHYIYNHRIHHYFVLTINCCHIYLALELLLASAAFLAGALLGLDLEPQFDAPYRAASFQDYWGHLWNGILRPCVYSPVSGWSGQAAGVMATFLVSGLIHEIIIFYYLTLSAPTGVVTCFFVLHGLCTASELWAKRSGRRPHAVVAVPIAIGLVVATAVWHFFPPVPGSGADERVPEECDCRRPQLRS